MASDADILAQDPPQQPPASEAGAPPPPGEYPAVDLAQEMRQDYLDYAMSTIVARAIPDARDGLKPVHRRILYGMEEGGYRSNVAYKKSARIVGDVMGKYHPHGDSAIYDAMVRMAQPFSLRMPLIDGQGNFGSIDRDPAAAMRYTEARLAKSAEFGLLTDIDKDTVDFQPNYDGSEKEPKVLPAALPNLLINGASGIAVGMATEIPPHNPVEAIDACIAWARNPDITIQELMQIIPGPDFPTGGIIRGTAGIVDAYTTGRGSIVVRGKAEIRPHPKRKGREQIIIEELPYGVVKKDLYAKIDELASPGEKGAAPIIAGIDEVRDESDRNGIALVIDVKPDGDATAILAQLYRYTDLQTTFSVNATAIDHGAPKLFTLVDFLRAFVDHRRIVIRRRSIFDLRKARDRLHVVAGLALAVDAIDRIIEIVRASGNPTEAREALMREVFTIASPRVRRMLELEAKRRRETIGDTIRLSEEQAKAILDLRLHKLTGLERDALVAEGDELVAKIEHLLRILNEPAALDTEMIGELEQIRAKVATERRSVFEMAEDDDTPLLMIPKEDVVVTLTTDSFIKRVPAAAFTAQKKGGKGKAAAKPTEDEVVAHAFSVSTHDSLLAITGDGVAYELPVHRIPAGTPQTRGRAIQNLIDVDPAKGFATFLPMPADPEQAPPYLIFVFSNGDIRKSSFHDFKKIKANGKRAARLEDEEGNRICELVGVYPASDDEDVLLFSSTGRCIRFHIDLLREVGSRDSTGVRGISLKKGGVVVGAAVVPHRDPVGDEDEVEVETPEGTEEDAAPQTVADDARVLFMVSARGYGKRVSSDEFPTKGRGGQGVTATRLVKGQVTEQAGEVVSVLPLIAGNDLIVTTEKGKVIRLRSDEIGLQSRSTRGNRLMDVPKGDRIGAVMQVLPQPTIEEGGDV